jgi:hypothetical protein
MTARKPTTARRERRAFLPPKPPADELPPHDVEAEKALVGSIFAAGTAGSQAQVDQIIQSTRAALFYDLRCRCAWQGIRDLRAAGHALDPITFESWCKSKGDLLSPADALEATFWQDKVPSHLIWPTYRDILTDLARRRNILALAARAKETARDTSIDPASMRREFAEILDDVARADSSSRPRLVIRKASERREYNPPPGIDLIGTAEIRKGHEGLTILAGPGSSGKSLLVGTLALAGAIGSGTWQGRKVHRRFKTLIVQGEVGPTRLRDQMREFARLHPEADLENHVWYSDPPEGGMAIADTEFWGELKRQVDQLKPDLVVIDPISHLSVQDDAAEVMNAIRVIRQAVGVGDDAPGLLLIAHTKKPRSEESMRGRNLANCVSGSVAWVNTSRCTYLCVPFDAEKIEDSRIYFACPKINDGPNYAPTVWKRTFGTFFEHDPETDPSTWGQEKSKDEAAAERQKLTFADLKAAFGTRPGMKRSELVRALKDLGHDEATCYRATGSDGYLRKYLVEAAGVLALRSP